MSKEIFEALKSLEQQNGIDKEALIDKIKLGLTRAIKHDYPYTENIRVEINPDEEIFSMGLIKTVVEGVPEDPDNEISIDEALTHDTTAHVGGVVEIAIDPLHLHRVAASSAKQSIRSDIKQYERERLIEQYRDKEHELVMATVQKVEPATGNAVIMIDKDEIYFPRGEHIPGEYFRPGDHIKVYVISIQPEKKPYVRVSRAHQDFVKRLLELEVPEIQSGAVEVKAVSREAGSRSKVAVYASDPNVDPIGACIGPKRARINAVTQELHGEKIDLILYSENDAEFIAKALAPAEVKHVDITINGEQKNCTAVVPDNQLSLAIGNKGQNAKLAARLTKFRIDIISETDYKAKKAEAGSAPETEPEPETEAEPMNEEPVQDVSEEEETAE